MSSHQAVMSELEAALGREPSPRTFSIMRQVTDLFVERAEIYSDDQIDVFDDIICRLIEHNGHQGAVEVSAKLAPCARGPAKVLRRLSSDSDIAVSGPLLRSNPTLSQDDLVELVKTRRREYLVLIAARPDLSEAVTDMLIERGDAEIFGILLANKGARISESGFVQLINDVKGNRELSLAIHQRPDLPEELRPFVEINLTKFEKPKA